MNSLASDQQLQLSKIESCFNCIIYLRKMSDSGSKMCKMYPLQTIHTKCIGDFTLPPAPLQYLWGWITFLSSQLWTPQKDNLNAVSGKDKYSYRGE